MNELTYKGKNLSEFGVFYDSHSAFNSPEKDVEMVEVFGRNGDLIIDNDRFRNVEVTFPCFIRSNFLPQYRNVLAFLQSSKGYNRLEYSQEPDHYRMAAFVSGAEPTPHQFHKTGRFPLVFNCLPQRFLKVGDTPITADGDSSSHTGDPVEIENPSGMDNVTALSVDINPVQDLSHGDPSPSNICPITGWSSANVVRTGKNLLPPTIYKFASLSGAVVSNNAYRSMIAKVDSGETYTISRDVISGNRFHIYGTSAQPRAGVATHIIAQQNSALTLTFTTSATDKYILVYLANDGSEITSNIQLELGSTATPYEPYSGQTYPISFSQAGTVYGGSVDVVSGVLKACPYYASYNGQTLTGEWISDRDVYAVGTTPTTGAQVVNIGGTKTTYQLTPTEVSLLTGTNYISADCGDVTVTVTEPSVLENPTLFDSKPIIRVYGNGTLNINSFYITVADSPYEYIDIDCELMDARYGLNNANQYVSFSTTDFITLKSGNNYVAPSGFTKVEITPRWYEI